MPILFTLGHGTLPSDAFALTLRAAGVTCVADVRRTPVSRRHPHFALPAMPAWLAAAGIAYRPFRDLGGRREPVPDSPNTGLRNRGFRGFADHLATAEGRAALDALLALATERPTAVCCAETLWWTCHRRIIADAATLLHGVEVVHLSNATRATHVVTPGARILDGTLRYEGTSDG